jgi:hypothetical protein
MLADASKPTILWKMLHPLLGLRPEDNRPLEKEPLLALLNALLGYSLRYLSGEDGPFGRSGWSAQGLVFLNVCGHRSRHFGKTLDRDLTFTGDEMMTYMPA